MTAMVFQLDERLSNDSAFVARLPLGDVRLMNDRRFVWCLYIPRVPGCRDWCDVPRSHATSFYGEIERVTEAVQAVSQAHKMNVASLGNIVEQLHVHVIGRHPGDAAWPGPVWGAGTPEVYAADEQGALIKTLQAQLRSDETR